MTKNKARIFHCRARFELLRSNHDFAAETDSKEPSSTEDTPFMISLAKRVGSMCLIYSSGEICPRPKRPESIKTD